MTDEEFNKIDLDKSPLDKLVMLADIKIKGIMKQREKICEAFIAETGCKPSEIEQVEEHGIGGTVRWYLRKRQL